MTRWLWYVNGVVVLSTLLILVFGLSTLPGQPFESMSVKTNQAAAATNGDGKLKSTDPEQKSDSPLVAAARAYSKRWEPPPPPKMPVVKAPVKQPEPQEKKPVTPPPPPPPPPEKKEPTPPPPPPKPPAPQFALRATMVIGSQKIAWGKSPEDKHDVMLQIGETLEGHYIVEEIGDGFMEVSRDGYTYKLEIPLPKPGIPVVAPMAPQPGPTPTRRTPTMRSPPPPRGATRTIRR